MQNNYRWRRNVSRLTNLAFGLLMAGLIGGGACALGIAYMKTEAVVTAKVMDKERVTTGGEHPISYWLVYCDSETFKNTDSLLFGKFNSADIQGRLERGHTYHLRVVGYRNPFFSSYRNIVGVDGEVQGPAP